LSLGMAATIARRELRGGVKGFRIFLACLTLGIAAIAAVGSVRQSIELGLAREGAALLGGDAEIELTYRFANENERQWMAQNSTAVSEIVDFRSMAIVDRDGQVDSGLTQVKAVDDAYPLIGLVLLDPDMTLAQALDGQDGVPGAVMDRLLVDRLGLTVGDIFRLGAQQFVLAAVLLKEPDNAAGIFALGPRTIVRTRALDQSGLLAPGTLFDSAYRLKTAPNVGLDDLETRAGDAIDGGGFRWHDRRDGAPGVAIFVERLGAFLILVGLAGLAVGGVGVSAAVRAYLDEKIRVIATLKALGADQRTIFQAYLIQIGALSVLGIGLGLTIGALLPIVLAPVISANLPLPIVAGLHPRPLAEAALYGALVAALFTIWPLSRTANVRASTLFRDASLGLSGWPAWRYVLFCGFMLAALVGVAGLFSASLRLTFWVAAGLLAAFAALLIISILVRILARGAARIQLFNQLTPLRLALGSIGGPGSETGAVILSLGLGLAVLASVGQIDANLRNTIARDMPKRAPSFFVVDIQSDQMTAYLDRVENDSGVDRVQSAPMLRGIITGINGRPASETAGDHWVISGDRGITYSEAPPQGADITDGVWWPRGYSGSPQISFSATEGAEMGLKLGDTLTVNVLGRDITATITSFREVDFSSAGMGFVLSMNPAAIAGAPHTFISTIYADESAQAAILRDLPRAFPNMTVISIGDAIERVAQVLANIAAAVTYGAIITLATGVVVLIGAAAAGERARTFEAAVLKTLGATRSIVLANFLLRSVILGTAAGIVAIATGAVAGWAVMVFVMEGDYEFEPFSALAIVAGGIGVTVLADILFSYRSLGARPGAVLRQHE